MGDPHKGSVLKQGYLNKKKSSGGLWKWNKRYFELRDTALVYYNSKPSHALHHKPSGVVELKSLSMVRRSAKSQNAFELIVRPHIVILQASNKTELEEWFLAMQTRLEQLQDDLNLEKGETRRGWLVKRAIKSKRNWKKRFFVLKYGRICYYEAVPDGVSVPMKPKGVLEITGSCSVYKVESPTEKGLRENTLTIKLAHTDVFLAADTQEEMNAWIAVVERAILREMGITGQAAVNVALWLRDAGLGQYAKRLVKSGYTSLDIFADCDEKDVEEVVRLVAMSDDEEFRFRRVMNDLLQDSLSDAKGVLNPSLSSRSFRTPSRQLSGRSLDISGGAARRSGLANTGHVPLQVTLQRGRISSRVQGSVDTRVYCWGDATDGKLGLPESRTWKMVQHPTHLEALRGKSQPSFIAAGETAMAAVSAQEGLVYTWGTGGNILGHGEQNESKDSSRKKKKPKPVKQTVDRPYLVKALRGTAVHTVSIGPTYMAALSGDGNMYTWGTGTDGQLGLGNKILDISYPERVPGVGSFVGDAVVDVCCARNHLLCITESGRLMTCGKGSDGRLGHGDEEDVYSPKLIQSMQGFKVSMIAAGNNFSIAITASRRDCYTWGSFHAGMIGALVPSRMEQFIPSEAGIITQVDASDTMAAFVVTNTTAAAGVERRTSSVHEWEARSRGRSRIGSMYVEEHEYASSVYTIGEDSVLLGHEDDGQVGRKRSSFGTHQDRTATLISAASGTSEAFDKSSRAETSSQTSSRSRGRRLRQQTSKGRNRLRDSPKVRLMASLENCGVVQVSCGKTHCAALCFNGELLLWGSDNKGELGTTYMLGVTIPHPAAQIVGYRYAFVSCGNHTTSALLVQDPSMKSIVPGQKVGDLIIPPPPPEEVLETSRVAKQQLEHMLATLSDVEVGSKTQSRDDSSNSSDRNTHSGNIPARGVGSNASDGPIRILPPGSRVFAPGWLEHTDATKNLKYYENEATKEVQWEPPSLTVLANSRKVPRDQVPPPPPEIESLNPW